jgi:hypothetical protein
MFNLPEVSRKRCSQELVVIRLHASDGCVPHAKVALSRFLSISEACRALGSHLQDGDALSLNTRNFEVVRTIADLIMSKETGWALAVVGELIVLLHQLGMDKDALRVAKAIKAHVHLEVNPGQQTAALGPLWEAACDYQTRVDVTDASADLWQTVKDWIAKQFNTCACQHCDGRLVLSSCRLIEGGIHSMSPACVSELFKYLAPDLAAPTPKALLRWRVPAANRTAAYHETDPVEFEQTRQLSFRLHGHLCDFVEIRSHSIFRCQVDGQLGRFVVGSRHDSPMYPTVKLVDADGNVSGSMHVQRSRSTGKLRVLTAMAEAMLGYEPDTIETLQCVRTHFDRPVLQEVFDSVIACELVIPAARLSPSDLDGVLAAIVDQGYACSIDHHISSFI